MLKAIAALVLFFGWGSVTLSHALTASFAAQGTFGASTGTGTFVVTQATPVVTWPPPAAITYGTALSGTQLNATANVQGTFVYTRGADAILDAGNPTLSLTFSPGDTTNYKAVTTRVQLVVNDASSSVSLSSTPNPSVSGQTVTLTATVLPQFGGTATGSIIFTGSVNGNLGSASIAGNVASLTTAGLRM